MVSTRNAYSVDSTASIRSALGVAQAAAQRDMYAIPVPHRTKEPALKGWQHQRLAPADLPKHFNGVPQNVGGLLGIAGPNGTKHVDIDIDNDDARPLVCAFLPATGAVYGREKRRATHLLYAITGDVPVTTKFLDPTKRDGEERAMLLEFRSVTQKGTPTQSLLPGSMHPDGDRYVWEQDGPAAEVDGNDLLARVGCLAAAVLLGHHWPGQGSRHDAALALAGGLARGGWGEDRVAEFVRSVAETAGDPEVHDRVGAARDTVRRLRGNGEATGWRTLAALLDEKVVGRARQWLGTPGEQESGTGGANERAPTGHPYRATDRGLVRLRTVRSGDGAGTVEEPLTNFTARIVADVAHDDGAEVRRLFEVEAGIGDRTRRFTVPAAQFAGMHWPVEHLGAAAVVYAGQGARDHARAAIQLLSAEIAGRHVYAHCGWREVGGALVYLHAGGAIGPDGPLGPEMVEVALSDRLGPLRLPVPPEGDALQAAVAASLAVLDVAPDRVTAPLLGAAHLAPLASALQPDVSVHLSGRTGTRKSELAALAQQHFGSGFDRLHLPAAWADTANALERLQHEAKDALVVVDDFAPSGTPVDVQQLHGKADRVLRGAGNRSGRGRMAANGTLRPAFPPRGVVLSTGEDVPRGESIRGRLAIAEVGPRDVDLTRLSEAQRAARRGDLAAATAGYLKWLASRLPALGAELHASVEELRDHQHRREHRATGAHARTPTSVALLGTAWRTWLRFATDTGALSQAAADTVWARVWRALCDLAGQQAAHVATQDPVRQYQELLASALGTGHAHVRTPEGGTPPDAERWGWHVRRDLAPAAPEPRGVQVGWLDGDDLYLDPPAAFACVQRLARDTGTTLAIQPQTLARRLHERGLLASTEQRGAETRHTVRRTLAGSRKAVMHMRAALLAEIPDQPAQPDQGAGDTPPIQVGAARQSAPAPGPEPPEHRAGTGPPAQHRTSAQRPAVAPSLGNPAATGPVGPVGPVIEGQSDKSAPAERAQTCQVHSKKVATHQWPDGTPLCADCFHELRRASGRAA